VSQVILLLIRWIISDSGVIISHKKQQLSKVVKKLCIINNSNLNKRRVINCMEEFIVFITLLIILPLFVWERIRHDIVALLALFTLVIAGIIPAENAFWGFGHPAVITVAAVLVIGKALEFSGLVDVMGKWVMKIGDNLLLQITVLSILVAVASAFINNVGALALMIPVAIHIAKKSNHPPSYILMPIAFASILGGMTTLIGTPPNIIIATIRSERFGEAFGMFDFTPVGLSIALVGILFISLIGWRILPKRTPRSGDEPFDIEDYIAEVQVERDSKAEGMTLSKIREEYDGDFQILGLVRNERRLHAPSRTEILKAKDVLILKTDADNLKSFLDEAELKLVGEKKFRQDAVGSEDIVNVETVVAANSPLVGQTASEMKMRSRYGINLLAIARQDTRIRKRIDQVRFKTGDVLLLQGREVIITDAMQRMGCLPLTPRELNIGSPRQIALALGIFAASIFTVVMGFLPVQIAFTMAAVGMVLTGILPVKKIYTSIDWPVIVLLGAMIPVGQALETSGGSEIIASGILELGNNFPVWALIGLIMVITMFLSDIINNAATVVLMAPISISVANNLALSVDPFLMAVAVGGSCAFLTPIGHQSNTLVMGPGGYKFSDYSRMGTPLEILIVLIGVPLILYFWPA